MSGNNLNEVAEQVVRLAQRQGYVVEREVREELVRANLSESLWKEVLAQVHPSLSYRRGRYYHPSTPAEPTAHSKVESAVTQLVTRHQSAPERVERREQGRIDFVQPVLVVTEDNRTFTLLTRDLSVTGIRLIGTRRLLGQKLRVQITLDDAAYEFTVRILWTCPVGDDLIENGGAILSVSSL